MKLFKSCVLICIPFTAFFIFLVIFSAASAAQVKLAWNPNDPKPDGYKVYKRAEGKNYDYKSPAWTGAGTSATLTNLADNVAHFFVVRAYVGNVESGNSNEVRASAVTSNTASPSTGDIHVSTSVILDNNEQGTSTIGTWIISGGSRPYGSNSLYSKDTGAKYTFSSQLSGRYEVGLWWTEYSSRCANVPVNIYDGSRLIDTVHVDQRNNGGRWNSLGNYDFSGTARVVVVSNGSSCSTCADAAQFSFISDTNIGTKSYSGDLASDDTQSDVASNTATGYDTDAVIVIDDGNPGTLEAGKWITSGGTHPYGSQSLYSKDIGARYTFASPLSGRYEVSLWWTGFSSRCANVPVNIYDGNELLKTVNVDQRQGGGLWNPLGIYNFSGTARVVVVSRDGSCSTCADAVEFCIDDDNDLINFRILDDGDRGTIAVGSWSTSGGTQPYGSQSLYSKGTGAKYIFSSQISGRYEVALWWTEYSSRCANVPVNIYDGSRLIDTVHVDQRKNGGRWNSLGDYDFSGVARVEVVSRDGTCSTCADAALYSK